MLLLLLLVKISVTNNLLELRTMGQVTLDDVSLKVVLRTITQSVDEALSKTVTRISNLYANE